MINFICLKWGSKYNAEFVNKLYGMVKRHYPISELHCITEDSFGINDRVKIIPLPEDNLEKWWWKMWLFNEDWMTLDNAVFLDLDLIIQDTFEIKFDVYPTFLYTDWIDVNQMNKDILTDRYKYCDINSSVLSWDNRTKRNMIWEDFVKYKDRIPKLFRGIDNYINYRHKGKYSLYNYKLAHSYWTTNRTWADVPVILFDYEEIKQDKIDEPWIHTQWKE